MVMIKNNKTGKTVTIQDFEKKTKIMREMMEISQTYNLNLMEEKTDFTTMESMAVLMWMTWFLNMIEYLTVDKHYWKVIFVN